VGVAVLSGVKVRRETAGLTAPESVGRQCAQLRGSGADLAFGPCLVYGGLPSGCKRAARPCSRSNGAA